MQTECNSQADGNFWNSMLWDLKKEFCVWLLMILENSPAQISDWTALECDFVWKLISFCHTMTHITMHLTTSFLHSINSMFAFDCPNKIEWTLMRAYKHAQIDITVWRRESFISIISINVEQIQIECPGHELQKAFLCARVIQFIGGLRTKIMSQSLCKPVPLLSSKTKTLEWNYIVCWWWMPLANLRAHGTSASRVYEWMMFV